MKLTHLKMISLYIQGDSDSVGQTDRIGRGAPGKHFEDRNLYPKTHSFAARVGLIG